MPEITGMLKDPGLKEKRDKPGEHFYSFKVDKETFYLHDNERDNALKPIVENLAGKNVELTYTLSEDKRWKNIVSVKEVVGVIVSDDKGGKDGRETYIIRQSCIKAAARLYAAIIATGKDVTPSMVIEAAEKFEIWVITGSSVIKKIPAQKAEPLPDEEPPPDEPSKLANLATDAQMARIRKELKARKIDTISETLLDYLNAKFDIGDIGDLSKTQASTMIDAFQSGELWPM